MDSITESEYIIASGGSLWKQFGQVSSFMNKKWSLELLIQYCSIRMTMEPLRKQIRATVSSKVQTGIQDDTI